MERVVALGLVFTFISSAYGLPDPLGERTSRVIVDNGQVGIGEITGGHFGAGAFSIGTPGTSSGPGGSGGAGGSGGPAQSIFPLNPAQGNGPYIIGPTNNGGQRETSRPPQSGVVAPNNLGGGNADQYNQNYQLNSQNAPANPGPGGNRKKNKGKGRRKNKKKICKVSSSTTESVLDDSSNESNGFSNSEYNYGNNGGHGANGFNAGGHGANGFNAGGHGASGFNAGGQDASGFSAGSQGASGFSAGGLGTSGFSAGGLDTSGYSAGGQGAVDYSAVAPNTGGRGGQGGGFVRGQGSSSHRGQGGSIQIGSITGGTFEQDPYFISPNIKPTVGRVPDLPTLPELPKLPALPPLPNLDSSYYQGSTGYSGVGQAKYNAGYNANTYGGGSTRGRFGNGQYNGYSNTPDSEYDTWVWGTSF